MEKHKAAVVTPGSFYIPSGRSSSVERVVEQMIPMVPQVSIREFTESGSPDALSSGRSTAGSRFIAFPEAPVMLRP